MDKLALTDEFFLIGHDEYSGKSLISGEVLDTGLAGGVLGELLLTGRITLVDGRVVIRDQHPYGENVTDAACAEIRRKGGPYPVRSWIEYLRAQVREMIARRLIAADLVRREQGRSMFRSIVRFPAADPITAAAPQVRLRYMLERPHLLDHQAALLAALVRTCALEHVLVLDIRPQQDGDLIARATTLLPPEGQSLLAGVDAAIAAIALTVRR